MKGATEHIVRKLRRILKGNPTASVLQVDLSNAFNTVDRSAALAALSKDVPELAAWCQFNYRTPAHLHCGERLFSSTQGTQQGDPLGPAMFAATIQPVLDEPPTVFRLLRQVWYLDGGILVGEEAELRRVLEFLTARFATLGLKVNLSKCRIWSPAAVPSPSCPVPTPTWDEPKIVLGVPFGSQAAEDAFLKAELVKQRTFLEGLRRFPDPQVALTLLRVCLGAQKVTHLLRVMWGPHAVSFAEAMEAELRLTLEEILGCGLDDAAWLQCGLPVKLGGLGVSPPSLVHVTAFLSSSLCEVAGYFSPDGELVAPDAALWKSLACFQHHVGTSGGLWTQWSRDGSLPRAEALENAGWLKQKSWMDLLHTTGVQGRNRRAQQKARRQKI